MRRRSLASISRSSKPSFYTSFYYQKQQPAISNSRSLDPSRIPLLLLLLLLLLFLLLGLRRRRERVRVVEVIIEFVGRYTPPHCIRHLGACRGGGVLGYVLKIPLLARQRPDHLCVCVCVCICMCVCMYIQANIYTHIEIYACICTCIHVHTCKHMYISVRGRVRTTWGRAIT